MRKTFLFHYVFAQSGLMGFYGNGDEYRHHKLFRPIPGFSFFNMVFVAKTMTVPSRIYPESSNTELVDGYKVKRWFPSSIWWSIWSLIKGYLLNAVGLANEGAEKILARQLLQKRLEYFQISFALTDTKETTLQDKITETEKFCDLLDKYMPASRYNFGIQINLSCPNTGHGQTQDPSHAIAVLQALRKRMPHVDLIPKFDFQISPESIVDIKPYCDAFCMGNTLPFGTKMPESWWKNLFRKGASPLLKFFGGKFSGGLSGAPLFPILVEWLERMQAYDPSVVIIAGGGIMTKKDIKTLSEFSIVHGVALGSVGILRPWRLQGLINYANELFQSRKKMVNDEKNHA